MKKYLLLIFIVCMCILPSCKDEYTICNLSKDVRFIGTFFQRISGADVLAPAPNLSITQIPTNALIFNQQPNVATFSFALNSVLDSAKYIFKIANNLQADTVTIVYTSTGENLSPECGAVTYHNILKITSTLNTIDSVKITNPKLNTDLLQNAKFYY